MSKAVKNEPDQIAVIMAIGRKDARSVAAIAEATGFDPRKVKRVLDSMEKSVLGDWFVDKEKNVKLGKRGVGRLRFPVRKGVAA